MYKKYLYWFWFSLILLSCRQNTSQENTQKIEYLLLEKPDGSIDTIYDSKLKGYNDSTLAVVRELKKLQEDPNHTFDLSDITDKKEENDTIRDEKGKPIEIKLGDSFYGASKQILTYDTKGRLQQIRGVNEDGITDEFLMNVAIKRFQYDINGNLTETRNYKPNEELISSKFDITPIVKQYYDNQNKLIEIWYLNEKEELRSEFDILKYRYKNGTRIVDGWFNKGGVKKVTNK